MSERLDAVVLIEDPDTLASFGAADDPTAAAPPIPIVFIPVRFETQGFGGFTAGSLDTLKGATGGNFPAGRVIRLRAKAERGHRFIHWEFRDGSSGPVFGGTNPVQTVLPRPGLVIKATFEAASAPSEPAVAEVETFTDADGLGAVQADPETFTVEDEGAWTVVEGSPSSELAAGAKILCRSEVGKLPKTVCRDQPMRVDTRHQVDIHNATDFPVEGTLVAILDIPGFGIVREKKDRVRVAPRSEKSFELTHGGTLKPNKTGRFSVGAITRFEGPASTPAAAARGFDVIDCP
jgi:hypothetical protein